MKTKNYKQLFKKTAMVIVLGISMNSFAESPEMVPDVLGLSPRIGSGSGGKIGSGAGGTESNRMQYFVSTASTDGDVVVPFPGIEPSEDSLVVHGEVGSGQDDLVTVVKCEEDEKGRLIAFSCKDTASGKLNKIISVPDGLLRVVYSKSVGLYHKKPGVALHLNLRKIMVPVAKEPITFNVFRDFKDPIEFKKLAQDYFGNYENLRVFHRVCDKTATSEPGSKNKEICEKLLLAIDVSKSPAEFVHASSRVNQKSELFEWDFDKQDFDNTGRFWIVDPKDGEFVSVLPGVYGIEWTNKNGDKASTYGIRVD